MSAKGDNRDVQKEERGQVAQRGNLIEVGSTTTSSDGERVHACTKGGWDVHARVDEV